MTKLTLEDARRGYPGAETFKFGDSERVCNLLLGFVRAGRKRAACEALAVYESGAAAMPVVGRRDIVLDWSGAPAMVIETTHIEILPFEDVGEAFALAEGEGDSLEDWRENHVAYFAGSVGYDAKMMIVCERFDLVEDFAA